MPSLLADIPASSATARALPLRMRRDLEVRAIGMRGRAQWVVKDPLALRYYQLREEEYFVLRLLDGRTSIDQIVSRFERQFAPRRLEPAQLQAFLGHLHREGLILSAVPGQGAELYERRKKLARLAWIEGLTNILALRLRGVDPDRFLRRLAPLCDWMFSAWFLTLCGLLICSALGLVGLHFDTLRERLPDFRAFFSAGNLLWLAAAVALAKVLHELGHALTCRHFGGECHEIGVMFLVFTPCLYCNVSDAWMMPSKWSRIAVGAAGMCVEMVLAAVATFVWWWTAPGLLNGLALDLMFVCSVSTLLFNGNPLLRYDGYYILSDLVEVPNLQQQAGRVISGWLGRWVWGIDPPPERLLPDGGRGWLAAYAVAAALYRMVVVVAVLWFLHRVLKPYHLEPIVPLIALAALGGLLIAPLVRCVNWVRDQNRNEPMRWGRFAVVAGLTIAALALLLSIPLPHHISAPAILEPSDARRVYVTSPGTLIEAVAAGDTVHTGQTLARLENRDVELEVARLQGQFDQQQLHLANLRSQQGTDPAAAAQIPAAEQALADLKTRLAERRRDQERLTLTAPCDGTVLPPHRETPPVGRGELPSWTETPLDPRNRGAYLDTGTLVCLIGDPDRLEVLAVVDQADVDFLRVDPADPQPVAIQFDELPGATLSGTVAAIAELDLKVAPRELAARQLLPTRPDETGTPRPLGTWYQVRVALDSHSAVLRDGATGRAKIYAAPQSLARRLIRYLEQTFEVRGAE